MVVIHVLSVWSNAGHRVGRQVPRIRTSAISRQGAVLTATVLLMNYEVTDLAALSSRKGTAYDSKLPL